MKPHFTFLLLVLFVAFFNVANSQSINFGYMSEGQAKLTTDEAVYVGVEGSPYVFDNWSPGEVKLSDGKTYPRLLLKYDEVAGLLMFKYSLKDSAMTFTIQPVEFIMSYITNNKMRDMRFLNGFDPIEGADVNTFYQVLCDGQVKLLKRTVKEIFSTSEYASAVKTKRINEKKYYYLAKGKQLTKVSNSKKAVLNYLNDKADKLKQYITDNKLDLGNDDDLAKLINYYNTI